MARLGLTLLAAVATIASMAPGVAAVFHHHNRRGVETRAHVLRVDRERVRHASQEPLAGGRVNPYANYTGPGSVVLNATVRAAGDPGVTLELAPDSKETATGGPVGGPPGYDGS